MIIKTETKPLVTILSPCYNVEKYLPKCLDSITNQTYPNLQIVLIDDGSKDGTWNIMQKYAIKDPRIEIYHQDNQGVSATRNHLLKKIKGDYVLFVDSDDWCELDMVEFLLCKAVDHNAEVSMCKLTFNDTQVQSKFIEDIYDKDTTIKEFLYHKDLRGSLCVKLIQSDLFDGLSFDTHISYGEDALFCWHIFQKVNIIINTTKELYHYRMNDQSLCHSIFDHRKLSGHYAWEKICGEVNKLWPQYINIAQARHCVDDTLLLRDAAHCKYNKKDDIKMLQKTIKELRHTLNEVNITSTKMKVYAFLASHSYWLAGKL